MKLGKVIRTYRVVNELSLRALGQEIGISAATLMRIEQGLDPDGPTLVKVQAWLAQPMQSVEKNGDRKRMR